MTIEDQLKQEILSQYKSVRAFTNEIGVPYTTLDSAFKRGIQNAGVTTMIKVFSALNLDIESIPSGELRPNTSNKKSPGGVEGGEGDELRSIEEAEHIKKYRLLDPYGKEAVDSILNIEHRRCAAKETTKLYIAARDGSRIETEIEGEITLPDESDDIPK